MTGDLNQKKGEVPEELAPSLGQLTTALRAVEDPGTSPQERDGVIRTARALSSTLDVIADPETPQPLRRQLTELVKQVTAVLDAANQSGTSPGQRRTYTLVAERSALALGVIGDHKTPQGLRVPLSGTVNNVTTAVTHDPPAKTLKLAKSVTASLVIISDPNTPDKERKELAETTHEASSSLDDQGDSDEQTERMKKKQEEAASAQGLPDEPLPKAAEICTNAVFDSVSDDTLNRDLKSVVPAKWKSEGVNDFWKSDASGDDSLDVLVQLLNEESVNARLKIKLLIPKLADAVPASELFETLATPGLHCLRVALQLDQDSGVKSGSWVKMAKEME
ncbi:hypothetical protein E5082_22745 [Streptomyces griseoluteus]|uniref:Uncharacterized protein n=1 Tax=Streptomyces griseoluteus TaxID=29306 RepID=A0A4Z1DBV9_STRGP|nr:hypothetical protein [Streptomyces griseoluteus]TGN80217.1 hypothetical protein E5082_22745 [Streptomyces griseoluteus]GHE95376.1 hypothetical protein GCM10017776_09690 [Streptomyces griseoluteus]